MAASSNADTITIIDDAGRTKQQRVKYRVTDVRGEEICVTAEGLQYVHDSLRRKRQHWFMPELERVSQALSRPDLVIVDPDAPEDTRVYYKQFFDRARNRRLMAVIVKQRAGVQFVYNVHPQQTGHVKGYNRVPAPAIWYIAPQHKPKAFGL